MAVSAFDQQYYGMLVQRIRAGDADAFTELYRATYNDMHRRVCALLHDPDDVHDALQEIYMSVWVNIGSLRLDRLVLPWMRQIAYHVCCDMLRRDLPRREATAELDEENIPAQSAESSFRQVYDRDTVQQAARILARLPVRVRQAFYLRYDAGMKLEDIAGFMGVSVTSVKRYIKAAKTALQQELTV